MEVFRGMVWNCCPHLQTSTWFNQIWLPVLLHELLELDLSSAWSWLGFLQEDFIVSILPATGAAADTQGMLWMAHLGPLPRCTPALWVLPTLTATGSQQSPTPENSPELWECARDSWLKRLSGCCGTGPVLEGHGGSVWGQMLTNPTSSLSFFPYWSFAPHFLMDFLWKHSFKKSPARDSLPQAVSRKPTKTPRALQISAALTSSLPHSPPALCPLIFCFLQWQVQLFLFPTPRQWFPKQQTWRPYFIFLIFIFFFLNFK